MARHCLHRFWSPATLVSSLQESSWVWASLCRWIFPNWSLYICLYWLWAPAQAPLGKYRAEKCFHKWSLWCWRVWAVLWCPPRRVRTRPSSIFYLGPKCWSTKAPGCPPSYATCLCSTALSSSFVHLPPRLLRTKNHKNYSTNIFVYCLV